MCLCVSVCVCASVCVMVCVGVIVGGCGWDRGWDSRCEWEGGCGWVQVGGWGGSGVGATPVEGCYTAPIEAAKKSQAALRRVSDRAQLREAADELGLDALAIEGRAERRHVRLHLGEQHAHLGRVRVRVGVRVRVKGER